MSTISKVDPSTLGWVKTEIDETLKQARLAIESYAENTADDSRLRFCTTYLHQVLGTLQMVELDGAAMLALETESLAGAVLNGKVAPDAAVIETLIRAILTLPDYLARLQFGQPDAPLKFLSLLNELRARRGAEALNELDLFQPDLDVRPPRREDAARLSESDYAASAKSIRPAYQATLLNWLRDAGTRSLLADLAGMLEPLRQQAPIPLLEQFFWVAGGYLDALASGALEISNDRKKLLARIEQQIKKIADGADRSLLRNSTEALVKAMLYEVGHAHATAGRAAEIFRAFDLDELLPGSDSDYSIPTPEALQSVAEALGKEIAQAQDLLSTYFEHGDAGTLGTLAELLHRMSGTLEMLNVQTLKDLVDEVRGLVEALATGKIASREPLSLPMAGALLLLENSTRDIHATGISWKKQVKDTIDRLRHLRTGEGTENADGIEISDASLTDNEFRQLVAAVGGEVRVNLGKIEEMLETFAADPGQNALLDAVPGHLNQIQGALQILGQDQAAELVASTLQHIQDLRAGNLTADSAILDALAVAVGTIGAYIEGLERDRPNLESLLVAARRDMAAALTGKRPHSGNPEALLAEIEQHLTAWFGDHNDRAAIAGLQQDLRDVTWLAGAQNQERIARISEQMTSLLDMVGAGDATAEVVDTLRQSYETLVTLARGTLRAQELARAPARATSRDKADSVLAPSAPAAAAGKTASEPAEEADDDIMQIFIEDAREMIALINKTLPDWHADPSSRDVMLDLRRAFHTLKGSGRMVGASDISEFAWAVENMLNKVREGKIGHSGQMFDLLYKARDILPEMVAQLEGGPALQGDVLALRAAAEAISDGRPAIMPVSASSLPPAVPEDGNVGMIEAAPASMVEAHVDTPDTGSGQDTLPQLDAALLQIFSTETRGHLASVRTELDKCREGGLGCQVSNSLVRAAHTLQGTARAVGIRPLAEVGAEAEKLLQTFQSHQQPLDAPAYTLFERLIAVVEQLIETLERAETHAPELLQEFSQVAQGAREAQVHVSRGAEPSVSPAPEAPRSAPTTSVTVTPVAETAPVTRLPVTPKKARPAASVFVEETLDPELMEIFLEEAVDILSAIEESLARWRGNRADKNAVAELKRQLHTLKGGARMAGAMTVGNLGHQTESLLNEIESGRVDADADLMDLMDEVHDALVAMIDRMQGQKPVPVFTALIDKVMTRSGHGPVVSPSAAVTPAAEQSAAVAPADRPWMPAMAADPVAATANDARVPHLDQREDVAEASEGAMEAMDSAAAIDRRGQIRVRTSLLNNLVNFAGEVSISRSRMEQQIFGMRENLAELNRNVTRFRDQIRDLEIQSESQILARFQEQASRAGEDFDPLELDRFSRLQTLSRSLAENLHDLFTIRGNLENYASQAETVLIQQARINTDLQEGLMRTRMIGFASQGARLRHIVRQTAREVGKRVSLEIIGGEVEVDRTVLERMIGPFEHMIRNAIDHGIEPEAERKRAGKPASGRITVTTSHEGSEIVIRFVDDGAGLDTAAIRRNATERGLMKASANLSDDELIQFILMPGFSTADKVTQISGRGVGMDVVHNEVKQLGGSITVDTRRGQGTTFIIRLPLTLSISQALMVRAGDQLFAVPISAVVNILEVPMDELRSIHVGTRPLLNWQDQVYPFMHLAARLDINPQPASERKVPVLLARSGGRQVAIQVDGLAGTREIVIKPLGQQLAGIEGLAGATILGDGSVVLILDISGLWLTEEGLHVTHAPATGAVAEPVAAAALPPAAAPSAGVRAQIMVVDDSITVRKVTQRHLQKRGMDVLQAKDGIDALDQLREHVPDLMLVDIEMPRMDGYELTQRIRSDARLKNVPIIMITSRAGDKHRDKAFALGVNLYMTKPYQEEDLVSKINSLLPPHLASA
jgi:chemosensory pili system protein ChpA (sensor histidine kinase/response regulator)